MFIGENKRKKHITPRTYINLYIAILFLQYCCFKLFSFPFFISSFCNELAMDPIKSSIQRRFMVAFQLNFVRKREINHNRIIVYKHSSLVINLY